MIPWHSVQHGEIVQQRYLAALDMFVSRVKQDSYIIAAILFGSLSYDSVWEKSDIDIDLLTRDDKTKERFYTLVEDGINFHARIIPRSKFKAELERAQDGSFTHSVLSRSTLLFSTDESIQEYYRDVQHVGSLDREMQLLKAASWVLPILTKAEKWLLVKNDPLYSFHWIMNLVNQLAFIEVIWQREIPGREVIQQALKHNPDFFHRIYTDLIQKPKDHETVWQAIQSIHNYLDERLSILFGPILSYLSEVGGVRSSSEIDEYFKKRAQVPTLSTTYEWLADKGVIQKVATPVRLTEKSRITVNEAAYYYDGGNL